MKCIRILVVWLLTIILNYMRDGIVEDSQISSMLKKKVFVFHFSLFVFGGIKIKDIWIWRDINISQTFWEITGFFDIMLQSPDGSNNP